MPGDEPFIIPNAGARQAWGQNLLGRALMVVRAERMVDDGSLKVGSGSPE